MLGEAAAGLAVGAAVVEVPGLATGLAGDELAAGLGAAIAAGCAAALELATIRAKKAKNILAVAP